MNQKCKGNDAWEVTLILLGDLAREYSTLETREGQTDRYTDLHVTLVKTFSLFLLEDLKDHFERLVRNLNRGNHLTPELAQKHRKFRREYKKIFPTTWSRDSRPFEKTTVADLQSRHREAALVDLGKLMKTVTSALDIGEELQRHGKRR